MTSCQTTDLLDGVYDAMPGHDFHCFRSVDRSEPVQWCPYFWREIIGRDSAFFWQNTCGTCHSYLRTHKWVEYEQECKHVCKYNPEICLALAAGVVSAETDKFNNWDDIDVPYITLAWEANYVLEDVHDGPNLNTTDRRVAFCQQLKLPHHLLKPVLHHVDHWDPPALQFCEIMHHPRSRTFENNDPDAGSQPDSNDSDPDVENTVPVRALPRPVLSPLPLPRGVLRHLTEVTAVAQPPSPSRVSPRTHLGKMSGTGTLGDPYVFDVPDQ